MKGEVQEGLTETLGENDLNNGVRLDWASDDFLALAPKKWIVQDELEYLRVDFERSYR